MTKNYWRHIVIKHDLGSEDCYEIYEGYYKSDPNKIHSWTDEGITPCGSSIEDLKWCLEMMLRAIERGDIYKEDGDKLIKITDKPD